jgi:hypothetical protein
MRRGRGLTDTNFMNDANRMQNQERGSSNIAAILPSTSSTAGAADAAAVLAASGIQSPMPALGGGWRKPSRREETEILKDYIEELKEGFKTLRVLEGTRNVEKDSAHTLALPSRLTPR